MEKKTDPVTVVIHDDDKLLIYTLYAAGRRGRASRGGSR